MARPLLYQPGQKWRIRAAFGVAVLIHCAAVAIASIHQHTQVAEVFPSQGEFPIVDVVDPSPPMDDPMPPPELPAPSPNQVDESMFPNDRLTSSPVRHQITKLAAPILKVRNGVTSGSLSLSSAGISALSAPRPEYPYEARRQKITGNGIAVMTVDSASGRVINVVMQESTENPVLDNAAVAAFRRWRFKPGTVSRVKSPITFTLAGAQY
jgi:protein TonB